MSVANSYFVFLYLQPRKSMLSVEATQNLLACFMWIIKTVDGAIFKQWWSEMPESRINSLLEVFYYAVSNFEYKGKKAMQRYSLQTIKKSVDMKSKLEEAILGNLSCRSDMIMRRKTSQQFSQAGSSAWHLVYFSRSTSI